MVYAKFFKLLNTIFIFPEITVLCQIFLKPIINSNLLRHLRHSVRIVRNRVIIHICQWILCIIWFRKWCIYKILVFYNLTRSTTIWNKSSLYHPEYVILHYQTEFLISNPHILPYRQTRI